MKKLNVAFIGVGSIANWAHLPAVKELENVNVMAFADIDENALKTTAEKYGVKNTFTDYNKMLEMDEIDAVHVCTPNYVHMQPAIDALKAGKHVLCEKPIARTVAEAKKMKEAADSTGKKLMIAQCRRFSGPTQCLKRFIDDGILGDIYFARIWALRRRGIPGWGVFTDKEKQGGGPLIDIGVHILDLTLYLMGNPKPITTSGMAVAKIGNTPGHVGLMGSWDHTKFTVEDYAAGFVRFEDGRSLILESSFAANIEPTEIVRSNLLGTKAGAELDDKLRIFGERCGALTNGEVFGYPEVNHFKEEFIAFYKSIEEDTPVPVPADQAINCLRILEGIYRSQDAGREIRMDEF
ncbi:MAG: Gfo/Idh/MocA family oxidoreductase [Abditibacteriota bacterium]|nr:Gfo/Idh/MocA family oxidoreductase [Abditibacteriota bacterium]